MIIRTAPEQNMTEKQQKTYAWACGKLKKLILCGFTGEFDVYFSMGGIRNTKTTHHESPKL